MPYSFSKKSWKAEVTEVLAPNKVVTKDCSKVNISTYDKIEKSGEQFGITAIEKSAIDLSYTLEEKQVNVSPVSGDAFNAGGNQFFRLDNGWLVYTHISTDEQLTYYISKDLGKTWQTHGSPTADPQAPSKAYIASSAVIGTKIYTVYYDKGTATNAFDAKFYLTWTDFSIPASISFTKFSTVEPCRGIQNTGISLAIDVSRQTLYLALTYVSQQIPNSANLKVLRYNLAGTSPTVTKEEWLTTENYTSKDHCCPCLVLKRDDIPIIRWLFNDHVGSTPESQIYTYEFTNRSAWQQIHVNNFSQLQLRGITMTYIPAEIANKIPAASFTEGRLVCAIIENNTSYNSVIIRSEVSDSGGHDWKDKKSHYNKLDIKEPAISYIDSGAYFIYYTASFENAPMRVHREAKYPGLDWQTISIAIPSTAGKTIPCIGLSFASSNVILYERTGVGMYLYGAWTDRQGYLTFTFDKALNVAVNEVLQGIAIEDRLYTKPVILRKFSSANIALYKADTGREQIATGSGGTTWKMNSSHVYLEVGDNVVIRNVTYTIVALQDNGWTSILDKPLPDDIAVGESVYLIYMWPYLNDLRARPIYSDNKKDIFAVSGLNTTQAVLQVRGKGAQLNQFAVAVE